MDPIGGPHLAESIRRSPAVAQPAFLLLVVVFLARVWIEPRRCEALRSCSCPGRCWRKWWGSRPAPPHDGAPHPGGAGRPTPGAANAEETAGVCAVASSRPGTTRRKCPILWRTDTHDDPTAIAIIDGCLWVATFLNRVFAVDPRDGDVLDEATLDNRGPASASSGECPDAPNAEVRRSVTRWTRTGSRWV